MVTKAKPTDDDIENIAGDKMMNDMPDNSLIETTTHSTNKKHEVKPKKNASTTIQNCTMLGNILLILLRVLNNFCF